MVKILRRMEFWNYRTAGHSIPKHSRSWNKPYLVLFPYTLIGYGHENNGKTTKFGHYFRNKHDYVEKNYRKLKSNVCSAEKLTKRSRNTVLRLVSFSAEQTLPISMTSLFAHKVAQLTKLRFLPKNLSQLVIFVIGLAFTWVWGDKNRAQF